MTKGGAGVWGHAVGISLEMAFALCRMAGESLIPTIASTSSMTSDMACVLEGGTGMMLVFSHGEASWFFKAGFAPSVGWLADGTASLSS